MTPKMNLVLNKIGVSENYVDTINQNFQVIDSHDHVGVGNLLTQESVSWNNVDLNNAGILQSNTLSFLNLSMNVSQKPCIFLKNGNYNYLDAENNLIQLTSNGTLNVLASFNGFFGDLGSFGAYCEYNDEDANYLFDSNQTTSLYFKDLEANALNLKNLLILNNFTNDTQVDMITSGSFPGDLDLNQNVTFFIDSEGVLRSAYITKESEPFTFLAGFSEAIGGNDVNYTYPATNFLAGLCRNLLEARRPPVDYNPQALAGSIVGIYGGYRSGSGEDPNRRSPNFGVQTISNPIRLLTNPDVLSSYNFQSGDNQARPLYMNVIMTPGNTGYSFQRETEGFLYCELIFPGYNDGYLYLWGYNHNIIFSPSTQEKDVLDVSQIYTQVVFEGLMDQTYGSDPLPPQYALCFAHNNTQGLELTNLDFKVAISMWGVWLNGPNYG